MSYPLGQPVPLSIIVSDATGAPANAGAVVLTVTQPDGTVVTPAVTNPSTGTYTATLTPAAVGRYSYQWVATGANASASPADVFTVTGPLATGIVGLDEVKDSLRLVGVDVARDNRLRGYIDAATAMITEQVGPLVTTRYTEVHDGGGPFIMLRQIPVVAIVSITEYVARVGYPLTSQPNGATVDQFGYSLWAEGGKVSRRDSAGQVTRFRGGRQSITVTYDAGMTGVNPAIRMAVIEDIRALWSQTQNGSQPTPFGDAQADNEWSAGPMTLFPRAAAILTGYQRLPGIA